MPNSIFQCQTHLKNAKFVKSGSEKCQMAALVPFATDRRLFAPGHNHRVHWFVRSPVGRRTLTKSSAKDRRPPFIAIAIAHPPARLASANKKRGGRKRDNRRTGYLAGASAGQNRQCDSDSLLRPPTREPGGPASLRASERVHSTAIFFVASPYRRKCHSSASSAPHRPGPMQTPTKPQGTQPQSNADGQQVCDRGGGSKASRI